MTPCLGILRSAAEGVEHALCAAFLSDRRGAMAFLAVSWYVADFTVSVLRLILNITGLKRGIDACHVRGLFADQLKDAHPAIHRAFIHVESCMFRIKTA